MRQAGYLAAAGIYALDNNVNRLEQDHQRAKALGEALENSPLIKSVEPIETNIVIFYLKDNEDENQFIEKLAVKNRAQAIAFYYSSRLAIDQPIGHSIRQ